jgi:hypothetical protein
MVGRSTICCTNGDPYCCDSTKDESCPTECDDCEVRRNYVRALKSYIDASLWTAFKVDWTEEPNWLDLAICKATEDEASMFVECLHRAEDN